MDLRKKLHALAWDVLEDLGVVSCLTTPDSMHIAAWSRQRPKYKKRPRSTATRREVRRDKKRYRLRKSKLKRYRMQNKRRLKEYQKHYKKRPNAHKVKGRV